MSQISPPIRILLVLTAAVLGAYMLFLRPKPEEAAPIEPANTSVSEPGKARDAAQDAVDAANGQLAQQESVDGVDAGEAAAGTATKADEAAKAGTTAATPAKDLKGLPKPVRRAIRQDKVLVLLFWNEKSADDRAVRRALGEVRTYDGRVFVHAAPLKRISRYGRIARGVNVEQSPTIVVADRDLKAQTLVGFVDSVSINQAVVDTLKNTNGLFTDAYLRKVDKVCVSHSNRMASLPGFYVDGPREADRRIAAYEQGFARFAADFKAVKAPKRWRAFHAASVADIAAFSALIHDVSTALTPTSATPSAVGVINGADASAKPIEKRANKRFDAQGLLRCGSQF